MDLLVLQKLGELIRLRSDFNSPIILINKLQTIKIWKNELKFIKKYVNKNSPPERAKIFIRINLEKIDQ